MKRVGSNPPYMSERAIVKRRYSGGVEDSVANYDLDGRKVGVWSQSSVKGRTLPKAVAPPTLQPALICSTTTPKTPANSLLSPKLDKLSRDRKMESKRIPVDPQNPSALLVEGGLCEGVRSTLRIYHFWWRGATFDTPFNKLACAFLYHLHSSSKNPYLRTNA